MRKSLWNIGIVLLVVLSLSLVTAIAFAADQWVVVKDSKGTCKVIKAKGKTPKTIAGPFAKKEDAVKAKDEKCPKKGKK
jgi:hypothetical protein